jgi:hypothetical protein
LLPPSNSQLSGISIHLVFPHLVFSNKTKVAFLLLGSATPNPCPNTWPIRWSGQ